MGRLRTGVLIVVAGALLAPASAWASEVDVVVRLDSPGLAEATAQSRVLTTATKQRRLELGSPTSRSYLAAVDAAQARFEARLARQLPQARVHRRYRIVFNGLAVSLPAGELRKLERIADVYPSTTYRTRLERSVPFVGAPQVWSLPGVAAGEGAKIAILDTGIDQTHPFFAPAGYTMPAGFPRGETSFTSAKVIVARVFTPRSSPLPVIRVPADQATSDHGTHVAGIAAGNAGTLTPGGVRLSGIAPRAYLGNYRVLAVRTNAGPNGNAPEIAAGVEAAVADGMDVINLSLGEAEIEPSHDLVELAIDGAARAGVPTVASAGNEFLLLGSGSVSSPGSVASAITVGAVENRDEPGTVAEYSSGGPTPVSLRLKPDVAAPGSDVRSAAPGGDWALLSGTSMAAPHVTGAVALLRKRHPDWTTEQLRSALVTTATTFGGESPLRTGGGLVNVERADRPLVFARPSVLSFGILRPGSRSTTSIRLDDAGGGAGTWRATLPGGGEVDVTVPGELSVSFVAPTAQGDRAGFVLLRRGVETRRVPYWARVDSPRLARPQRTLRRTGTYSGSTVGRPSRVDRYRYPALGVALDGPEQVFRVTLRRSVANFGAVVLSGAVSPRVVLAGDENRVVGWAGVPLNLNPFQGRWLRPQPVAGAIRPAAGSYDVVFDSRSRPARFAFRFWIDDVRAPTVRLPSRVIRGGALRVRVTDAGAGVDPRTVVARVDGVRRPVRFAAGIATVDVGGLRRGRHALRFEASDYQEAKNMENVPRILPNTRVLTTSFTLR
jgi:subtilisin family serine protease